MTPLVLPSDHLEACRVLCDHLAKLGPIDDGDGIVADRVRDAHRLLLSALSGAQSCLPRRGDDWQTGTPPPCTCKPILPAEAPPSAHHGKCQAGKVRWVHVNDTGLPGCVSCRRIRQYVPARKGCDRCDWCARWKAAKGTDPLPELLELHHAGKRITDVAVRQAELAAKRKADEAKKRDAHKRKVKR